MYGNFYWLQNRSMRSIFQDYVKMRHVFKNYAVAAYHNPLRALLIPISDPLCVPWPVHHEHFLRDGLQDDLENLEERRGEPRSLLAGIVFAGYLKQVGRFEDVRSICARMIALDHRFEGYLGLADIEHLQARWSAEMQTYRDGGYFRPGQPVSPGDFALPDDRARQGFARAVALYRKALAARPDSVAGRRALGRALVDAGQIEQGVAEFAGIEARSRLARHALAYTAPSSGQDAAPRLREVSLDALTCFPVPTARMRRFRMVSTRKAADLLRGSAECTNPATTLSGTYVADSHGPDVREMHLEFPAVWASAFGNVRSLKHGILIADDQLLITDGKGLSGSHRKLFSPELYAVDRDRAIVGLWPAEHAFSDDAILLIGAVFNYYHWMLETLPALMTLATDPSTADASICPELPLQPFQADSLRMVMPAAQKVSVLDHDVRSYWFKRVHHVQNSSVYMVPRPTSVLMVRDRLSKHLPVPTPGKRVYLSRKSAGSRQNQNEKALMQLLARYSVAPVDTGGMSVAEQIEFFKDVELIVAPAGAALTNLIFCPSATRVVIMTSAPHHFETFTAIAVAIGQPCWVSMGSGPIRPNPYFVWTTFDLEVNLPSLRRCLEAATTA
jgi:hypothetical protein